MGKQQVRLPVLLVVALAVAGDFGGAGFKVAQAVTDDGMKQQVRLPVLLVVALAVAGGFGGAGFEVARAQYTAADYNCTATMTYTQRRTGAAEGPPPGRPNANFTVALVEYEAAFSGISAAPWTLSWNWTIAGNSTLDAASLAGAGVADTSSTAQDINFSGTGAEVRRGRPVVVAATWLSDARQPGGAVACSFDRRAPTADSAAGKRLTAATTCRR